jgi:hypothetical protein
MLSESELEVIRSMVASNGGAKPFPTSFSGWEPKRLWRLGADGGYEETAYAEGFDSRLDGRSLVAADFDGDGDQELLMLSRAGVRLQLFENVGQNGRAVELELWPRGGSRDAEGVLVRAPGLGVFSTSLARGYASAVPPTLHLGLGNRKEITLEVQWRDGKRETFGPLPAGMRHQLAEGHAPKARSSEKFQRPREERLPAWPGTLAALGLEPAPQPTVVQLFTRGCKPCAEEAPVLAKLQGARVVALGIVAEGDTPEAAAASLGIKTEAKVLPESAAEALSRSGELPLPLLLVYGADGALKRVLPGPAQLADALK